MFRLNLYILIILFIISIIFVILPVTVNIFTKNNLQWISVLSSLYVIGLGTILLKKYSKKNLNTIYISNSPISSPKISDIANAIQLKNLENDPNVILYKKIIKNNMNH
jgi:hypothetical protein